MLPWQMQTWLLLLHPLQHSRRRSHAQQGMLPAVLQECLQQHRQV
jgi:hypothetical protein